MLGCLYIFYSITVIGILNGFISCVLSEAYSNLFYQCLTHLPSILSHASAVPAFLRGQTCGS